MSARRDLDRVLRRDETSSGLSASVLFNFLLFFVCLPASSPPFTVAASEAPTPRALRPSRTFCLPSLHPSTISSTAQFRRKRTSCSFARQTGHFPSALRHLRIQMLQNVWEQFVIMGVVKKSLHTRQRKSASIELSGCDSVVGIEGGRVGAAKSVGSETSAMSTLCIED